VNFSEADITGCDFSLCEFEDCHLEGAVISPETTFNNADLRGATFVGS
ncbi:MAG TPA: hypothetical protein DEW32_02955, partial [Dehalococcoidia bacterium]|nr:hypothetical protein [Dehalococcoidia bacterium]